MYTLILNIFKVLTMGRSSRGYIGGIAALKIDTSIEILFRLDFQLQVAAAPTLLLEYVDQYHIPAEWRLGKAQANKSK